MNNKNLLIIAAICFVLGTLTRFMEGMPPDNATLNSQETAKIGLPSPEFSFTDIRGKQASLTNYKNKIVILNFWATWCPPCVTEFPSMLDLARKTQDDTVFIFISSDTNEEAIHRFMDKMANTHAHELGLPNVIIVHDRTKAITQSLFQTYRLPETYILAPGLIVEDKIIGAIDWDTPKMIARIRELAAKQGKTKG